MWLDSNIRSTDLWKTAETEKKKLFDLMEQVQAKLSKKSKGQYQPLDLSTCKWGDVMSEVQETSQKWKSMPGNMAKARKCLETLGQDSGAFQTWLELLPAGDYGARYLTCSCSIPEILIPISICGVFKLAVGVSQTRLYSLIHSITPGRCTDSNLRQQVDTSKSRRKFSMHSQSFLR
jgi:hypothetical protein